MKKILTLFCAMLGMATMGWASPMTVTVEGNTVDSEVVYDLTSALSVVTDPTETDVTITIITTAVEDQIVFTASDAEKSNTATLTVTAEELVASITYGLEITVEELLAQDGSTESTSWANGISSIASLTVSCNVSNQDQFQSVSYSYEPHSFECSLTLNIGDYDLSSGNYFAIFVYDDADLISANWKCGFRDVIVTVDGEEVDMTGCTGYNDDFDSGCLKLFESWGSLAETPISSDASEMVVTFSIVARWSDFGENELEGLYFKIQIVPAAGGELVLTYTGAEILEGAVYLGLADVGIQYKAYLEFSCNTSDGEGVARWGSEEDAPYAVVTGNGTYTITTDLLNSVTGINFMTIEMKDIGDGDENAKDYNIGEIQGTIDSFTVDDVELETFDSSKVYENWQGGGYRLDIVNTYDDDFTDYAIPTTTSIDGTVVVTFTLKGFTKKASNAIQEVKSSVEAVEVARYNLMGQKISGEQKGINIIVYSDGSSKKVLVK